MDKNTVVVIGSGLAALTAARELSGHFNVMIFTKNPLGASSWKAQGGIAAAIHETDNGKQHYMDTMDAGLNHNDPEAVSVLVKEGKDAVAGLIASGMKFDQGLGLEGAHSVRRIFHAGGDRTGKKMMEHVLSDCSDLMIDEQRRVIDLAVSGGVCKGVIVKDIHTGALEYVAASAVIIATGGCGGLYDVTSNDPALIGDGLAMAYRAGAALTDMEFVQFHPTLLYKNNTAYGLISEAVRGEGAVLVNGRGERMMGWHPRKDLAPRDVISRTLASFAANREDIWLDVTKVKKFRERFPGAAALCTQAGVRLEDGRIPVRPGAHFSIGGIETSLNGESTLLGLYAVGEAACTGVHGANRLASNSLLETLVFGKKAARHIIFQYAKAFEHAGITGHWKEEAPPAALPSISMIRQMVTRCAGIEKDENGLKELLAWLKDCRIESHFHSFRGYWPLEAIEVSNGLITADLLASSSLARSESRGTHFRRDLPNTENVKWRRRRIRQQLTQQTQGEVQTK
ncbi:L-aspartate oxidase [Alteribacter lacisalsi]|nr:L-aspartate oxidase [Alteribacter lacisalsi]